MSYTRKCPICDTEAPVVTYHEGNIVSEEDAHCPKGHWDYEFSYGAYRESIGNQEWYWGYNTSGEIMAEIEEQMKTAIKVYRAAYLTERNLHE